MSNSELLLKYIAAYNAKDVEGILQCFADDCLFENISAGKLTVRIQGKAELEALAKKSVAAFVSRNQTVISMTEAQSELLPRLIIMPSCRRTLARN